MSNLTEPNRARWLKGIPEKKQVPIQMLLKADRIVKVTDTGIRIEVD